MNKIITVAAVSAMLSACGGSGTPTESSEPTIGAAVASTPTNTSDLRVDENFDFASSRSIDIEFDIEEAALSDASVSICTDYHPGGDAYDVNYESCTVNGDMQDGKFKHVMDVTNEFDSVVAVVWFQDPSTEPLYKEFFVSDSTTRSKQEKPTLVWR